MLLCRYIRWFVPCSRLLASISFWMRSALLVCHRTKPIISHTRNNWCNGIIFWRRTYPRRNEFSLHIGSHQHTTIWSTFTWQTLSSVLADNVSAQIRNFEFSMMTINNTFKSDHIFQWNRTKYTAPQKNLFDMPEIFLECSNYRIFIDKTASKKIFAINHSEKKKVD